MKKISRFSLCLLIASLCFTLPGAPKKQNPTATAYQQGCSAFSRGEWETAVFLLRQTVTDPAFDTADTNYMLIMAEIYAGNNKAALSDCDSFLNSFSKSLYTQRILYTKGKLLYSLGEYEKAIVTLSDFCHKNEGHELYPSALFYIAESLYAGYKFDQAEDIYERIVTQYPSSEKVSAAQYRLESIAQRSREEKLLYLLKQTGEEYLAAKEEYEKQLKLYNSDSITREKLVDYQQKNKELEEQIADLERQIAELKILQAQSDAALAQKQAEEEQRIKAQEMAAMAEKERKEEEIRRLKQKAQVVQQLIDE
jgi:TolA-binding protein